jgi:hypothetical protein
MEQFTTPAGESAGISATSGAAQTSARGAPGRGPLRSKLVAAWLASLFGVLASIGGIWAGAALGW